jgi:hypothetical protein
MGSVIRDRTIAEAVQDGDLSVYQVLAGKKNYSRRNSSYQGSA